MKKALSVFLAVFMLISVMAISASAADLRDPVKCHCTDHIKGGPCHCCIYCDNLDTSWKLACANKNDDGTWSFCCADCNGLKNCACTDCKCCADKDEDISDNDSNNPITENLQNSFVQGFRNALGKVQKVFDDFFNRIFEFLRIDELEELIKNGWTNN